MNKSELLNHISKECTNTVIICNLCHVRDTREKYVDHDQLTCIKTLNATIEEQKAEIAKLKGGAAEKDASPADPAPQVCPAGHNMQEQHNVTQYPCNLCRRYDNDVYYNCLVC